MTWSYQMSKSTNHEWLIMKSLNHAYFSKSSWTIKLSTPSITWSLSRHSSIAHGKCSCLCLTAFRSISNRLRNATPCSFLISLSFLPFVDVYQQYYGYLMFNLQKINTIMASDTVLATRMRKISTGSDCTESSEDSNHPPRYDLMVSNSQSVFSNENRILEFRWDDGGHCKHEYRCVWEHKKV